MGETYDRNRYPLPGTNKRPTSTHSSAVSRSLQDFGPTTTTTTAVRESRMRETMISDSEEEANRRVTSSSISWSIPMDVAAGDPLPPLPSSPIY